MRPSGATTSELHALANLLHARFPKGDCQVVRMNNSSNNIGFGVSGQNVLIGSSAVLNLAKHYSKWFSASFAIESWINVVHREFTVVFMITKHFDDMFISIL